MAGDRMQRVRLSSIDIGTNTVLLLVADVADDGTVEPLLQEQRIPRLGRGVDALRRLSVDSMNRVIGVLQEYRTLMAPFGCTTASVCGTSVLRDAANSREFARRVSDETGFQLEVLSGDEEALWGYRGATSGVPSLNSALVVDIGGGSTEFSVGDRELLRECTSIDTGSVRVTERYFRHVPPREREIQEARQRVRDAIPRLELPSGATFIGVAGTVTSLAILDQGLKEFRVEAVTNGRLARSSVDRLFAMLSRTPVAEILRLSSVMEGRADIITAGALILQEIMEHFKRDEILVSERGVRYGILLREWERLRTRG